MENLQLAGFWGRLFPWDVRIIDKNGVRAGFFRRFLRRVYAFLPLILLLACAWVRTLQTQPGINQLMVTYDGFDKLNGEIPSPHSPEQKFLLGFFLAVFFISPSFIVLWAIGKARLFVTKRSFADYFSGTSAVYKTYRPFSSHDWKAWLTLLLKSLIAAIMAVLWTILIVICSWGFYNSFDESLRPETAAFFKTAPFNPQNNFYVAVVGLTAPAGTKDLQAYGLKVINKEIDPAQNALVFKYADPHKTVCSSPWDFANNKENCLTPDEVEKTYRANAEIIARFQSLYRQTGLIVSPGDKFAPDSVPGVGQDIIGSEQILAAKWAEEAKNGHGKDAIEEWLLNAAFIKKVKSGQIEFIDFAVWTVADGINISALPVILQNDPPLIPLYKDRVITALDYDEMKIWNVADTMRAALNWQYLILPKNFSNNLLIHPNAARNKLYDLAQDMIHLSQQPPQNLVAEHQKLDEKYDCVLSPKCFAYNGITNLLLDGIVKAGQLYLNAYAKTASRRATILWVQAKSQNIPASAMPVFLNASPPSLYDPFTNKPFQWDASKNSIFFNRNSTTGEKNRFDVYY